MCDIVLTILKDAVKSKIFRCMLILAGLLLYVFNTITDWMFYNEVTLLKNGLVYGVIEPSMQICILVQSVISILFLLVDVYIVYLDFKKSWKTNSSHDDDTIDLDNDIVPHDIVTALSLWLDAMPKVIVNLVLAGCHEYSFSWLQLFKAAFILFCAFIRIILLLYRYYIDSQNFDTLLEKDKSQRLIDKFRHEWKVRSVITGIRSFICLGLLCQIIILALTFSLTYVEDLNGKLNFKKPSFVYEDKLLHVGHYFKDASIFVDYDLMIPDKSSLSNNRWLQLCTIQEVMEVPKSKLNSEIKISLVFFKDGNVTSFQLTKSNSNSDLPLCFQDDGTNYLKVDCSSLKLKIVSISFSFRFKTPGPSLPFGDIVYNVSTQVTPNNNFVSSTDLGIKLVYFVVKKTGYVNQPLKSTASQFNLFSREEDLMPIRSIWKTGYLKCTSTANNNPTYNIYDN